MSFFGDQDVRCPFYTKSDNASISCEGVEDHMSTKSIFRAESGALLREDKERYMIKFCNSDYEKCRICQMLMQKYD